MRARAGVAALVAAALLVVAGASGAAVVVPGAPAPRVSVPTASGAAVVVPGARAAATSPLAGLTRARREVGALAGTARTVNSRTLLGAARSDLASATAAALWIDPSHPVAPEYGQSVFAGSRAALRALEAVPPSAVASGTAAIAGVEASVLTADRRVALAAIRQGVGGPGGLLRRAEGMILSGDRWSQTSRIDLGAVQYGAAWGEAFEALTMVVQLRTSLVSPGTLGTAAENALGRPSLAPTGVQALTGRAPLTSSGKPEVLFVGLQSCRFCAVERWGLVAALSQFGSFENLHLSQSATTEQPVVRSFTFHGSTYQSSYISFDPVELTSDVPRPGGGYRTLDRLTPAQRVLVHALDPAGISPFVDVADQFADIGATVSPAPLAGAPWGALTASLRQPRSLAGQAIAATAEVLTAEICHATGGVPIAVCASPAVQDYASRLARFGGQGGGCRIAGARALAGRRHSS